MDLLDDLNASQREAVTHLDGPILILAGAGSGKTRVITCRIAYLLQQGVRPSNILAITFTNKAAEEMRRRVEAIVPQSKVWVSTFHSLGARLLRMYADRLDLERNFTIYDQADRRKVVKSALDLCGIDNVRFTPERIESAISRAKNQLLLPEQYAKRAHDFFTQTVAEVYPVYYKKLRDANALDFDDLLLWPALALKHDDQLRAELDSRFRYVLIDEYQDTNSAQYGMARGLSQDQPNLCVVGDPDQSIYKWRGADIRNILDFERDFPDTKVIPLEWNYRSTAAILSAASSLIAHNRNRKPKSLRTEKTGGAPVRVMLFETGLEEADGIARRISEAVQQGQRQYRDAAVFVRVNALTRSLEQAFIRHQVPFQIVRGLAFFERKENKDVLAYLRLLMNPRDDISFVRMVNEPPRGIGKVSLAHLQAYAEPREMSLLSAAAEVEKITAIRGKAAAGLKQFAELMRELSTFAEASPDEVIRVVLDQSGYRQMLKSSSDAEDRERLENIEELITAAREFAREDEERTLADFLEKITLVSDADGWDNQQNCVSVMTLHAAKGLEFPVVFMVAVEQGLLPHERSLSSNNRDEEIEEERRLAFVGMTRAKEELHLTYARTRDFRGATMYAVPSSFLEELPQDEIEKLDLAMAGVGSAYHQWRGGGSAAQQGWRDAGFFPKKSKAKETDLPDLPQDDEYYEGQLVAHDKYGIGRVMELTGYGVKRKVKVRFNKFGDKTFMVKQVQLEAVQK